MIGYKFIKKIWHKNIQKDIAHALIDMGLYVWGKRNKNHKAHQELHEFLASLSRSAEEKGLGVSPYYYYDQPHRRRTNV